MPQDNLPRILVVDDEMNICLSCTKILAKIDYTVDYALSGHDALEMMDLNPYDILITDLKMSRLGGMEVLRRVKEAYPETLVIVMTGYASVSSAVEVMKLGAIDYLPKPFTPDELRAIVGQAAAEREVRLQNRELQQQLRSRKPVSHQLIGSSPKIKQVVSMIQKVAPTDSTVLVYGESGTGKELVARAVHANSTRRTGVFFAVDCGTLSANLLESELFGHTRGAFTGADRDKAGIFRSADHGTVFLDEISNISLEVQGKLLRFLETREFLPLGGTAPVSVDIRLILATNKNLKELVAGGTFREDFYYRIYVYPILLPPLRDRKSDILPIAYHFLNQFNHKLSKKISGIDREAANRMLEYDWPGNVRQLKNTIERAAILCEREILSLQDLPLLAEGQEPEQPEKDMPATNAELKRAKKEIRRKAICRVEKSFVLKALAENDWNVTRAAQSVGLQRSNFHHLMKKYGITLQKGNPPS
ncbi:MAG: sigma-54-dependent Fis family transcriptional regulator [Desulfobacteraceae bacterium]|nr:MAG: sigma-54-dependent Fis family transcriptional regulator [Desulfobacteraceae bacterium]